MVSTGTVGEVLQVARDRKITFLAAAITYYALASVVPLLLLALALASLLGGEGFMEALIRDRLGSALSESGQDVLLRLSTGIEGQVGASVVGIVVAFWSGSKVFRGLDLAFSDVYDRHDDPSLPRQLLDAALVIAILVLAIAAMVAVGLLVSVVELPVNPTAVGAVVLFVTLVVVLLPLYYVLPPVGETVRGVLPGAVLAAVAFIVLQVLFLFYASNAGQYKALGILGALLMFVTWLYFGSVVLLLGATVNHVTGR